MILLTDEEIEKIANEAHDNEPYVGVNTAIAKAQLKKVVEILEDTYILAHTVKSWGVSGIVCEDGCRACAIWQALLSEIDDS